MAKSKKQPVAGKKRKRGKIALCVILSIVLAIALTVGVFAIMNVQSTKALMELANNFNVVQYEEGTRLTPVKDADGDWCFVTDRDFRIVQITDIHLGSGLLSAKKDRCPAAVLSECSFLSFSSRIFLLFAVSFVFLFQSSRSPVNMISLSFFLKVPKC